jgi:hypothetical protein
MDSVFEGLNQLLGKVFEVTHVFKEQICIMYNFKSCVDILKLQISTLESKVERPPPPPQPTHNPSQDETVPLFPYSPTWQSSGELWFP